MPRSTLASPAAIALAASIALLALAPPPVFARHAQLDLDNVPVERLVRNLEHALEDAPEDVTVMARLARVHLMAWALKQENLNVDRHTQEPWEGHQPPPLPREVVAAASAEAEDAARRHLERALELYARASELAPENWLVRLGYAYCLEQAGRRADAVEAYRAVVAGAWPRDELRTVALYGGTRFVSEEAASGLIGLLDPVEDVDEIAELRRRIEHFAHLPPSRRITPLAIPLRDGLGGRDLVDESARVRFDLDGFGAREWSWLRREAAWLVCDPRGTRRVESGLQLFGSVTFWVFWEHGYEALAALDDDGDGWLRAGELAGLALWHDADGDGRSDPGEVRRLDEHGIVALSCRSARDPASGYLWSEGGVLLGDGTARSSWDVVLASAAEPGTTPLRPAATPRGRP